MTPPFTPAWWLPGPHLPTIWGKFLKRVVPVSLHTERWTTPDDDFVDLLRLPAPSPAAPRVLLLHGLEGGAHSHYVHGMFADAARRGWGMEMLIFRGCGPELNRAPRFYHSGDTGDLAFVLDRLAREAPDAPRLLTGVSLGGNVILKYLGESGDALPPSVAAAATVSVPYDLARGSRYISRGFSRVYERHFLRSLKRKALAKLQEHPGLYDASRLARVQSLWEFDDVVTAPVHGFNDAGDYYHRSSSLRFLPGIRRPTLLLSAFDDPFLPPAVLDDVRAIATGNPALEPEFVSRGGHAGFVGGVVPWRAEYYAERRMMDFLAQRLSTTSNGQVHSAAAASSGTR